MTKTVLTVILTTTLMFGAVGCATHTGNAALAGGAGGALIGAGIGSLSHQRAGDGALLGGAIGAIGGAIVGNEMDRQEREGGYAASDAPVYPRTEYRDDYGYAPPRYSTTYYEPRGYVEVRTYRTYPAYHPGRYYGSYYCR